MTSLKYALFAGVLMAGALAAPAAQADWRHGGRGGYNHHRGYGGGAIVGGALLGLGLGAALAAPRYYGPPAVVYAPPPVYYAPAPYYAPSPYYAAPGYYVK